MNKCYGCGCEIDMGACVTWKAGETQDDKPWCSKECFDKYSNTILATVDESNAINPMTLVAKDIEPKLPPKQRLLNFAKKHKLLPTFWLGSKGYVAELCPEDRSWKIGILDKSATDAVDSAIRMTEEQMRLVAESGEGPFCSSVCAKESLMRRGLVPRPGESGYAEQPARRDAKAADIEQQRRDSTRQKVLKISRQLMEQVLLQVAELPEDVEIVAVGSDIWKDEIMFRLRSKEYPEVPDGNHLVEERVNGRTRLAAAVRAICDEIGDGTKQGLMLAVGKKMSDELARRGVK